MGSVRNPVGPLPSSIYWRRRVVLLCLLALVVVLVAVGLNSGGGGGDKGNGAPAGTHTPIATITAGPDPTGTHISGRPGGRNTSPGDNGSADGGAAGGSSGGGTTPTGDPTATPSDGGGASSAGVTGGSDGSGTTGGSGTTSTTGGPLPAGSTLPDCDPGSVSLALTSGQNSYSPEDTPTFQVRATNSGATSCKLDFGPRQAVFTITAAADSDHVWASDDCPAGGSYLLQVSAHGATTYTLRWDRKTSSPQCATPKGQQAGPGTYLVQAELPGYGPKQVSFVLAAD
ncbi:hypothetical protein [Streptomyces sp.]|uniref:hypothetical protein n=1 Tax=Streptomyces sp. TaxID=1931 RepID=UPI002F40B57A